MDILETAVPISKLVTGMGRTKGERLTSVYDPISERDFIDSIDKAIRQVDMGNYQEADEAIDEISAELET